MKNVLLILLIGIINIQAYAQKVERVIDGDTFILETEERVRLIGINAPELSDIFGSNSKEYLEQLIENKTITLEADPISAQTDRYGRSLRYVYVDGIDINRKMIADGFAFAYLKFKFEKSDEYSEAQILAKKEQMGIWENSDSKEQTVANSNPAYEKFKTKLNDFKFALIAGLVIILFSLGIYYRFSK
jgi:micrococcal nuclease